MGGPTRQNLLAGGVVALIALPLSLGIAAASGFPPVAGLITAIVGGLLVSAFGGAPPTIKGPAAGLIVVVLGAVHELGMGDPVAGYRRALAVGAVAALVQIALALARVGPLVSVVPPAVVQGMLASIGLLLFIRQAPLMLGIDGLTGEPIELAVSLFTHLASLEPASTVIGLGALTLLVAHASGRLPAWLRTIPAPALVLFLAIPAAIWLPHVIGTRPVARLAVPTDALSTLAKPDFSMITEATSVKYVVMLALIGSLESLLSVKAIEALDPHQRRFDLDRDLLATGIGNLACAMLGGLPMISEIVRSKANLDAGGDGAWANATHGALLAVLVFAVPGLLALVPVAALAAMLVYTGGRLASWRIASETWTIGTDQFAVFATTIAVTLTTDLLLGVIAGALIEAGLHLWRGASLPSLFRPPADLEERGGDVALRLHGPGTFTNVHHVQRLLEHLDPQVREVTVDVSEAPLVDRAFLARLETPGPVAVSLRGLDQLEATSAHPLAARVRRR